MRVNNPLLFHKFVAMLVGLLALAPVLLFVSLPFWAHTLLVLALAFSMFSWLIAAIEEDKKRNQ